MTPCQMKFRNQFAVTLTKIYAEKHPTASAVEPMVDHAFAVADAVCARINKDATALETERTEKAKAEFDSIPKEVKEVADGLAKGHAEECAGPKLMSLEELFNEFESVLRSAAAQR